MNNFDLSFTLSDSEISKSIEDTAELAVSLFGPVRHNQLMNRAERLMSNGSYAYLMRSVVIIEGTIEGVSIESLLFRPDLTLPNNPSHESENDDEDLPSVIFSGFGTQINIDSQLGTFEVARSQSQLVINSFGEHTVRSIEADDEQDGEEAQPDLIDQMAVADLRGILQG